MLKKPLSQQKLFQDFCKLDADRKKILTKVLEKEGIPYTILQIDSAYHILIYPNNLVSGKDATVLLSHYDRVKGSPGANDNSAAVFYLLYHAKKLLKLEHSTLIVFTDREEITKGDSITDQGSYGLARYFRSKQIENLRFFVFDMCGIGTTLLLGTGGENLLKNHYGKNFDSSGMKKKIDSVKQDAENTLLTINGGEFFYLTPLFSDDLGLILNKYPAVLISLLPYREAVEYKQNPSKLPSSWLCNHSPNDNLDTLDSRSWEVLSQLFSRLSLIEEPKELGLMEHNTFMCYNQKIDSLEISRGGIKKPLDYIIEPGFSISAIKSDYMDIIERFLLFSSKIESNASAYLSSLVSKRTEDLSYDLYLFILKAMKNEYKNLPKYIRDKIDKRSLEKKTTVEHYLYNNIMNNIKDGFAIHSTPINKKTMVELDFEKTKLNEYSVKISAKKREVGCIKVIKNENGFLLDRGDFIPDHFLRLDPLNLLKGVRLLLIKWVKLNNNNSLRINLTRSNWIGCDQFYRLLEMEMEDKTSTPDSPEHIYIWKRYNGK